MAAIAYSAFTPETRTTRVPPVGTVTPGETILPGIGEELAASTATVQKPLTRPELGVIALVVGVGGLCYAIAALVLMGERPSGAADPASWFKPAEGITIFAVFYVLAQVIERVLVPVARFVPTAAPAGTGDQVGPRLPGTRMRLTTRSRALRHRSLALSSCADSRTATRQEAEEQAEDAANWQETLQQVYVNARTTWALGAGIAFLLCAWLDVYLLNAIGTPSWNPPLGVDLLVTGLAIGGGTAPLHDLIDRLQRKEPTAVGDPTRVPTPGGGTVGIVAPSK